MINTINYDEVFREVRDFWTENTNCEATQIMAQFVTSLYWGEKVSLFDLKTLDNLDTQNFENCMLIAKYRRTPNWKDEKLYGLAMFAKPYLK
jgi:hypothetical protein